MVAKKIFRVLFDIRPTKKSGDLDVEKIKRIVPIVNLSNIVLREKYNVENDDFLFDNTLPKDIEVTEKLDKKAYEINIKDDNKYIANKTVKDVDDVFVISSVLNERNRYEQKLLGENIPSKEDLLAELLAIEEDDELLDQKHMQERSQQFSGNTVCLRPECYQDSPKNIEEKEKKDIYENKFKFQDLEIASKNKEISKKNDFLEIASEQDLENKFDKITIEKIKLFREKIEKFQDKSAENYFDSPNNKIKETPLPKEGKIPLNKIETGSYENSIDVMPYERITREDDVLLESASLVQLPKEWKKSLAIFAICSILVSSAVPALAFFQKGLQKKDKIIELSQEAYQALNAAKESASNVDFKQAGSDFDQAYKKFAAASYEIGGLNKVIIDVLGKIPGISIMKSGEYLLQIGQNISAAGKLVIDGITPFLNLEDDYWKNITGDESDLYFPKNSLTNAVFDSNNNLTMALDKLNKVEYDLAQVNVADLPEEVRESVLVLKEKVPFIKNGIENFLSYSDVILEILGHDSPKKYLFIFQNPGEMRATGGFIGTYGVLDMNSGYVNKVFVDGIYNPDGQLRTLIMPPKPIQKISANWSMHDSNWFADFPTSAQKVAWFYEKTGGPTVDGVIAVTPFIIEKLLRITGPIEMPEYNTVVDADNFVMNTQYEVELDYDKEVNKPKQFIADLAPKLFNKVLNAENKDWKKIIDVIRESLNEKHILFYFFDEDVQKFVADKNWDGRVLETERDYLSIINSNINGYKTDGVMEEDISHKAEVLEDGSVIDTVTIYRKHVGGNEEYDWWNRVNSDFMRVFVPVGSTLLDAKGHTKEADYKPHVDYSDYLEDPDVAELEKNMKIDEKTGTRIFEESGKTVFANWVYVSPGEDVTVTYKYKLPFKIDLARGLDKYSLLVQKQSGSEGSLFSHELVIPNSLNKIYEYPEKNENETALNEDRIFGSVLERVK